LTISIFADEVTYIAGSPQLELDMSKEVPYGTDSHGNPYYISRPSGTIRADYVSGSGTTRLDFQYTVQPGDLQESTFSSFKLVAGSLKDAVGNDARLNIYHIDSGYDLRIDAIAPVHVSGTQASADAVADDSAVGSLIYTASAIDEQSAVAYSLKAGDDAAMFRIDSVTGKVTLASSLDYGHNASHEYQFTVVAKDVLGNATEQKVTLHVTDHTAPTLVTSTPVDDAGNMAAGSSIVLTFSENVLAGSGSIHIVNDDDPSKSLHIDVADSSQVSISGATVTINPGSDLMAAAKYHVEVETGAFKDVAGNGYAGIGDSTTLNFTVAAPQSHTLMVYSEGVYLDNDGNGALSAGDTALLIKGAMGWEYTRLPQVRQAFMG
jgi:methionine-rich copper-binding protein CopC